MEGVVTDTSRVASTASEGGGRGCSGLASVVAGALSHT